MQSNAPSTVYRELPFRTHATKLEKTGVAKARHRYLKSSSHFRTKIRVWLAKAAFTRVPDGMDVESWVRSHFKGDSKFPRLLKLTMPNDDRELALRNLNRMNINHLSLFPDLYGASKFVNLDLLIEKY